MVETRVPPPPRNQPSAALLERAQGQRTRQYASRSDAPMPRQSRSFDVTFRQRELGLGLQARSDGLRVSQVSGSAARAGVQVGDRLVAVDGVTIPQTNAVDRAGRLLRNAPRPVRLTFRGEENRGRRNTDQGLSLPEPSRGNIAPPRPPPPPNSPPAMTVTTNSVEVTKIDAVIDLGPKSPNAHPRDAILILKNDNGDQAKIQIRAGLTAKRRRAVVAVRTASGWCADRVRSADILVAIDNALIAPPVGAKGVDALIAKCAKFAQRQRQGSNTRNTLVFVRSKDSRMDPLYTIALPVVQTSRGPQQWEGLPETTVPHDDLENPGGQHHRGPMAGRHPTNTHLTESWSKISRRLRISHRGQAITSSWGLELQEKKDALIISEHEGYGANKGDVVVLLENIPAARHTLLSFGVAADAAVVSADASGKKAVALTLACPELFLNQRELFTGPTHPTTNNGLRSEHKAQEEDHMHGGSLYFVAAPDMNANERLRLAETARLLRQGIGVELYTVVPGSSRIRARNATLYEFDDLNGIKLKPLNSGASTIVMLTDIIDVDVPMGLMTGVADAVIAASFRVSYRTNKATIHLDLATQSPVVARKLAQGIILLRDLRRRQSKGTSPPLVLNPSLTGQLRLSQLQRLSQIQATEYGRADGQSFSGAPEEYGGSIQWRPSGGRRLSLVRHSARVATSVATRRIAAVALTMHDQSNPRQKWWKTLRRGVVVEVLYADSSTFTINTPLGRAAGSSRSRGNQATPFHEGQYCRATVVRVLRTRDPSSENQNGNIIRYILKYKDGPYNCDIIDPAMNAVKKLPNGTLFVGVPRDCIVVKFSAQELYLPLTTVALSIAQLCAFLYYARRKPGGFNEIGASQPTVGPGVLHYFLTSEFPGCRDVRKQYWRLFTYQFAHIGYVHIASNLFVQLVFGIPVELVHGHFTLFFVYQLGVAAGSLTCAFSDIHKAVVGASGGVYTLIGLHSSDVLVNFRAMSQDIRLLLRGTLCLIVPSVDLFVYIFLQQDNNTSYSAHIGGWIAGFLFGLAFLRQVSESFFHIYFVRPIATLLLIAYLLFAFGWYQFTYPPKYFLNGPFWQLSSYRQQDHAGSCCWLLQDCEDDIGITKDDYRRFSCDEGTTVYGGKFFANEVLQPLETCSALAEYLFSHPE